VRRRLPHFLWLAAWSFWLWLGFGLYRELPRDLGPVVCQVKLRGLVEAFLQSPPEIVSLDRYAKKKNMKMSAASSSTIGRSRPVFRQRADLLEQLVGKDLLRKPLNG